MCLGNICRSPTAEAVSAHLLAQRGLAERVSVDSAGTAGWNEGRPPDSRATAQVEKRGLRMRGKARRFRKGDFARFDLVVAMDRSNRELLIDMVDDPGDVAKVRMLREFSSVAPGLVDVADPYHGTERDYEAVYEVIADACRNLVDYVEDMVR